ncbi:LuxR C-terminal-related transcriptional regulator [Kitasatospora sp. NPDC059327]|uniref:LuxR C-terminal-related transcriptional regulator n=1 Tax=Kitasatospora sp. NPDC059327 TaxID=3346803 RepID=UPI00368797D1
MTTPPTAERPPGAPAAHPAAHSTARPTASADPPAPQGRPGKGRAGRGRGPKAGKGAKAPTTAAAARATETGPATGGSGDGPGGGSGGGPAAESGGRQDEALRLLRQLTPREAQALAQLAAGRDLAQAAAALGVTPATARSYQHRAMRKLGTRTHAEIAAFAALLSPAQSAATQQDTSRGRSGPTGRSPSRGQRPSTVRSPSTSTAGPPDGPRSDTPAGQPAGRDRRGRGKARPAAPDTPAPAVSPGTARAGDDEPPRPATTKAAVRPDTTVTDTTAADTTAAAGPAATPTERSRTEGGATTGRAPAAGGTARPNGREPAATGGGTAGTARPAPAGPAATVPAAATPPAPVRSFEELYEAAHTRLVQQVFLLTSCKHRAVHCVRLAFGEARRRWDEVAAGADPEGWVRARACEAALSPWHRGGPRRAHVWRLPHRRIKVRPADESQAVLPDHDRLTDRDRALLKALKRLSRPQRRALVLHDGLGLPAAAVAVEVESTVAAAEGRVWAGRAALAQWVPELVGSDPAEAGFADRLAGLLHRAAVRGCPQTHRPPVPLLRARHGLANATRTGAAVLITLAVGGAAAATLAGNGPGSLFRRPPEAVEQSVCGAVNGSAVPLAPDGPLTGIRSLWCSPTPGVEPVVTDPPPPRAPRWELPAAGRAPAALPPPGPAVGPSACTRWALHPCPADH